MVAPIPTNSAQASAFRLSTFFDGKCGICESDSFEIYPKNRFARRNFTQAQPRDFIAACLGCAKTIHKGPNTLKPEKRKHIERLLGEGFPIREVARMTGHNKITVSTIRRELGFDVKCPCGRDSRHQGWCSVRVKRSPARLCFLAKWLGFNSPDDLYQPKKKAKPVPEYERPFIAYEKETELPLLVGRMALSLDAEMGADDERTLHSRIASDNQKRRYEKSKYDRSMEDRINDFAKTLTERMRLILWDVDAASEEDREALLRESELFKLRDYLAA